MVSKLYKVLISIRKQFYDVMYVCTKRGGIGQRFTNDIWSLRHIDEWL